MPTKPGWQSTEVWLSAFAGAALYKVIDAVSAAGGSLSLGSGIALGLGMAAIGWIAGRYIDGRSRVKTNGG